MCGPDRVLFRALRFCNGPFFYLKIGFDIGRVFAKCIISDEFFLWFIYRLSKSTYASQFRGKLGNGEHLSLEASKYKEYNIYVLIIMQ